MRGGAVRSRCFLALLLSSAVGALDQFTSQDLKHGGLSGSGESSVSPYADVLANSQTASPGGEKLDRNLVQETDDEAALRNSAYASAVANGGSSASALSSVQGQGDASAQAFSGGSSPYGSGDGFAQAQADASTGYGGQADASAQALSGGLSPYGSGYPNSGYGLAKAQTDAQALSGGLSSAQAQAYAQAMSGGFAQAQADASAQALSGGLSPYGSGAGYPSSSNPGSMYPSFNYPNSQLGSAQAQADATAQVISGGSRPYGSGTGYPNSGYPGSSYPSYSYPTSSYPSSEYGSIQAQADAKAQAVNKGSGQFGLGYPSSNYPGSAYPNSQYGTAQADASAQALSGGYDSQAQAVASAQASSGGLSPYSSEYPVSTYPGSQYGSAQADASAQALSGGYGSQAQADASALASSGGLNPYSSKYPGSAYTGPEYSSAQADAIALANGAGSASASASSSALAYSGPRSRVIPVYELVHPEQIPGANNVIQCQQEGELHNLWSASHECMVCTCLRQYGALRPVCASCGGCQGLLPAPRPLPPPTPQPTPQVSCDPLPTDQYFQNPLNPCQVCTCSPVNVLGRPEVQITCQDNPQCILPPDAPVIPQIPDVPIPLPLCERFPQNVLFPHPSDACRLCKCTVRVAPYGRPEQHIECRPNPDCESRPSPAPQPYPSPQPLAQVSCDPLPSDQYFQNPLNPCQTCICSPVNVYGRPEVKITCQENPACVVPPDAPVIPPIPDVPVPLPLCERFPQNVLFPHPSDACRLCKCTVRVAPYGRPEQHIECRPNPDCEQGPLPTPYPPPYPPPYPAPYPSPEPQRQVSCDPLPTNKVFQNPLNPCKLCVCSPATVFGVPDVKITCKSNPMCVLPPDAPVIPPIPDVPVPLPLCEKFPQNVVFPHPTDYCRLCKCVVRVTMFGNPEQHIECAPNPECENRPFPPEPFPPPYPTPYPPEFPPSPEPFPVPPSPGPVPPSPYPQPIPFPVPDVTPEPVPWPPKPRPGPLPGPSPHESCLPYPPNVPFQHPWDDCQTCMCSETRAIGLVSIEVNCYTKPSCCVEVPPLSPPAPRPVPVLPPFIPQQAALQILDVICEYRTFGVEFVHPTDTCRLCSCEIYGHLVVPVCKREQRQECSDRPAVIPNGQIEYIGERPVYTKPYSSPRPLPYYGSSNSHASADATAEAQSFSYASAEANAQAQSYSQASADATALAQSYNPGAQYMMPGPLQPGDGNQYLVPGQLQTGGGQSSALAHAQASLMNSQGGRNYPYQVPGNQPGSGVSSAEAHANAIAEYNQNQQFYSGPTYPQTPSSSAPPYYIPAVYVTPSNPPNLPGSLSPEYYQAPSGGQSKADASAFVQTAPAPTFYPYASNSNSYPFTPIGYPDLNQGGYSSAQAKAIAEAESGQGPLTSNYNNNPYSQNGYLSNYSPVDSRSLNEGNAQYYDPNSNSYPRNGQPNAEADAEAVAASDMYSSLYPRPSPQRTPLYAPGHNGWDTGATAPQSIPLLRGDTNGQSLAQANAQAPGQARAEAQAQAGSGSAGPESAGLL